ncbi:hypothetical protein [Neolewinella xylanilytica]|nr:hypothetical protein [Neolewinella xylanilytica]
MKLSFSKLSLLLLTAVALAFTSCDDDDDPILGGEIGDDGTLFLSSNTSGMVGILSLEDEPLEIETFAAQGTDADGIYYDDDQGNIFQVNRTSNTVVEYNDVIDDLDDPNGVDIESESSSDFDNGRGLAYRNDMLVVANDGDTDSTNAFYRYEITGDEEISYVGMHPTNINLWGIQFFGTSLYAVVDNSDSIAIFDNFLDNAAGDTVVPTRYIQIDGITRTHGLEYNSEDDIMILTDIGDAASNSDGGIMIIDNFTSVANDSVITAADYTMISGASTMLGNPVDVAYDADEDRIYVADRATEMLLIFDMDMSGDVAPAESLAFPGISSLFLYRD